VVRSTGRIAILGAGSWGTALALLYARRESEVRLWGRAPAVMEAMASAGENARYLPGFPLPAPVRPTAHLDRAVADADLVLLAVPSAAIPDLCADLAPRLPADVVCVGLAKGLHPATGRRLSEVATKALGERGRAQLLGPSHAEEVARGMPTAVVLAGAPPQVESELQTRLSSDTLRVYTNKDLIGVELAAALKNVLAIAAGICDGIGLGDNTKGALLTRGVAEMARLGVALGARQETFFGLAGIGDVITTCLSRHSRNRAFGELIGRGTAREEGLAQVGQVVEGAETTRTACRLAADHGVSLPIATTVERVVFGGMDPREAIDHLMSRDLRSEDEPPG